MRLWPVIGLLLAATRAFADVSVVATVDRNRIGFGESAVLTITVQGSQGGTPSIPRVEGLSFNGPSTQTSMSINNMQMTQSSSFTYQVTPSRTGEFTIPAIEVIIDSVTQDKAAGGDVAGARAAHARTNRAYHRAFCAAQQPRRV